jgi:ribosomal protein S20
MTGIKLGFRFNGLSLPLPETQPVGSSPALRAQQKAGRAEEAKTLSERSERSRFKAIMKKFGNERALKLGVPREMVDAAERAAARRERKIAAKGAKSE